MLDPSSSNYEKIEYDDEQEHEHVEVWRFRIGRMSLCHARVYLDCGGGKTLAEGGFSNPPSCYFRFGGLENPPSEEFHYPRAAKAVSPLARYATALQIAPFAYFSAVLALLDRS